MADSKEKYEILYVKHCNLCPTYSYPPKYYCKGPIDDMPKNSWINVEQIATKVMHPHLEYKCTLMILRNLAKPEWITVPCFEELVGDLMCMVRRKPKIYKAIDLSYNPIVYRKQCVSIEGNCYSFTWMSSVKATQINKRNLADTSNMTKYKVIFDAIMAELPPIFDMTIKYVVRYKAFSNIFLWTKRHFHKDQTNALVIEKEYSDQYNINKNNVFICKSGTLISNIYICDGKGDCPEDVPSDEINCSCNINNKYNTKCRILVNKQGILICSLFYIALKDKSCQPTWKLDIKYHVTKKQDKTIKCSHGNVIDHKIQNNLLPDCDVEVNDNNVMSFSIQESNCTGKGQILCRKGQLTCFNISDVCIYRLDNHGSLIPCRTGEHIQNCNHFECNMKVKCPGFYCIPWQYICDGKWDCPGGFDELQRDKCVEMKKM